MPPLRALLRWLGVLVDAGDWLVDGQVLACAYPRRERALAGLHRRGISVLVNLHERPHDAARLRRYGLVDVHVPVRDFTAPTPAQLRRGVAAIEDAVGDGKRVAVHCGGGLGRTGTLLACYLISRGHSPADAMARVRACRPGSIETRAQVDAIKAYGRSRTATADGGA
ncbi:MAG: dual specificity protein phosphatase family protein [Chloroflexi bacterium]|nr:dual specificity protein phosphatase family protein [Chloroflexota bacterium]